MTIDDEGIIQLGDNPGPEALGHDAVILPEQRRKVLDAIEQTGAIDFREDGEPLLPFIKNPRD